jgi:hypothetical protein
VLDDDVTALRVYVATHLGENWVEWPGGRPGEAEVALVDAVMSIRARYGRPGSTQDDVLLAPTGVHRAVAAYRALRGKGPLDDLRVLAQIDAVFLERAVGAQKTARVPKAEAIVRAAGALVSAGCSLPTTLSRLTPVKSVRRPRCAASAGLPGSTSGCCSAGPGSRPIAGWCRR